MPTSNKKWNTGDPNANGFYAINYNGKIDENAYWNGSWWESPKFGCGGSNDLKWKRQSNNEHS